MKILSSIISFFSLIKELIIVIAAKMRQAQRKKEIKKVEEFKKETVKEVEKGEIDKINEKLKF
jgi:hypothetical protein